MSNENSGLDPDQAFEDAVEMVGDKRPAVEVVKRIEPREEMFQRTNNSFFEVSRGEYSSRIDYTVDESGKVHISVSEMPANTGVENYSQELGIETVEEALTLAENYGVLNSDQTGEASYEASNAEI